MPDRRLKAVWDVQVPVIRELAGVHEYDGVVMDLSPRDQALAAWGSKFSLRRFHEALLALGAPPLGTMGDALLG